MERLLSRRSDLNR